MRIFSTLGQLLSTSQFYFFGRSKCTRTGWLNAAKVYSDNDILSQPGFSLSDKVFIVTGANGGIGKEMTTFLAQKQATVYMFCRSAERGGAVREKIVEATHNDKVHLIVGDCGLESDVRRMWDEFVDHRKSVTGSATLSGVQLHGLVCNAGALLSELTYTAEEVEVTFATHLLFGTYLLGTLAMHVLTETPDSRLVVVSSGGMYNTKFPAWEAATSTGNATGKPVEELYDGQMVYAIAKRGQVLLCEEWAKQYGSKVAIVSCHPGMLSV
jgi:dehydrogenase/reductase SDR family member 12